MNTYTIFSIKQENHPISEICSYRIFSMGFKKEFEAAMVNEPSVFEPLSSTVLTWGPDFLYLLFGESSLGCVLLPLLSTVPCKRYKLLV